MNFLSRIKRLWRYVKAMSEVKVYPNVSKSAHVHWSVKVYNPNNLVMGENTNIGARTVIMNTRARFVMKSNCGAAFGLTVVTGGHLAVVGVEAKHVTNEMKEKYDVNHEIDKDVVVEEEVWIASNVTLLSGVRLQRGSTVGAGSVVRRSVPPYAVVIGNPAKVVGFRFTPEEIIEHEKILYSENERLTLALLERNYDKYYLSRMGEIKEFMRL